MAHPAKSSTKSDSGQGVPRPKIAELLRIPRGYRLREGASLTNPDFVLVNESLEGPIKPSEVQLNKDYTRDEIIVLIGGAYQEFTDLVRELDEVKMASVRLTQEAQGAKAREAAAEGRLLTLHTMATGLKTPERGVLLDVQRSANLRKQAFNVLTAIAYGHQTADQIRETAKKFVEHAASNPSALVNEKPDGQSSEIQGPDNSGPQEA